MPVGGSKHKREIQFLPLFCEAGNAVGFCNSDVKRRGVNRYRIARRNKLVAYIGYRRLGKVAVRRTDNAFLGGRIRNACTAVGGKFSFKRRKLFH